MSQRATVHHVQRRTSLNSLCDTKGWSKIDQNRIRIRFIVVMGGVLTMTEQSTNSEKEKIEDGSDSDVAIQKRLDRVAERAAEKASHTEQSYDQDHSVFTK